MPLAPGTRSASAGAWCRHWNSSRQFSFWFRSTLGLRRLDGEWRIVHEHTSTPFHMDGSGRAATDLQP